MCGIETKPKMSECEVLMNNITPIEVLQWKQIEMQGASNGKQNTQLELGLSICAMKDVVMKLVKSFEMNRLHQAQYEWRDTIRKVDQYMSDPNLHRVMCTDFGAILDLSTAEKDYSFVNNHAVLCIFCIDIS